MNSETGKSNENMMENESESYIPGVCNIGKKEIRRRKLFAIAGLLITVICILIMQVYHTNRAWRLLIFFPAASSATGFIQAYSKFCLAFGMKGVFNFGNIGSTFSTGQKEHLKKDRKKAIQILSLSMALGLGFAIAYFLLPV